MFTVKLTDGTETRIGRRTFCQLCGMSDETIRQCGYDPESIAAAYAELARKVAAAQS